MNSKDAFEILKLEPNSSIEQIKKAYRNLSFQHHPDRNVGSNEFFLQVKLAYLYLIGLNEDGACVTKPIKQPPPNEFNLELTLEEIFSGCTKREKISRKVISENGDEKTEEKILNVEVKPGLLNNTRITIEKEGDLYHGKIPANVVFVVQEKPHTTFKRVRFDLKYTATITAEDAILGCEVNVPTLDNDTLHLAIEESIDQNTVRRIAKRGFPYPNVPEKRGDLIVTFDIIEQPESIVNDLFLSLSQIMYGCSKRIKINRKAIAIDGTEDYEDKILTVQIKPGTMEGTKITFPREGNYVSNGLQSDVVFVERVRPNESFKRNESDLIYIAQITPNEANQGFSLSIPIIDTDDPINFNVVGPINKLGYRIVGRGLPKVDDEQKRGDLVIQFEIVQQDDPIEKELILTLEEVNSGCLKQIEHKRKIINNVAKEKIENVVLDVKINPGIEEGTRITLPKQGDMHPGRIPNDIILIVQSNPHENFKRNKADLELTIKISQIDLVKQNQLEIITLQNEIKVLPIDKTFNQHTVKRILGCGLPCTNNPNEKGDLLVSFEIIAETKPKDNDIEVDLPLTLENILHGCNKRMKINRRIKTKANGKEIFKNEIVDINIKPGTLEGTTFRFEKLGDVNSGTIPADIVFIARDKPHETFKRREADILYALRFPSNEVKSIGSMNIPTLEGIFIQSPNVVKPLQFTGQLKYPERGLPLVDDPNKRGFLIVVYEFENVIENSSKIEQILSKNKTENLIKNIKTILDELNAQNYQSQLEKFKKLKIDAKDHIKGVVSLVLDVVVNEHCKVKQLALFCSDVSYIKLIEKNLDGENVEVKFKNILIKNCEETFFKNLYLDIYNYDERVKEIESCGDELKKKELEQIFLSEKQLSFHRYIGNIKLIAELYNLNMLNSKIMFSCLHNLLKHKHEDYIECLCVLVTNIGAK